MHERLTLAGGKVRWRRSWSVGGVPPDGRGGHDCEQTKEKTREKKKAGVKVMGRELWQDRGGRLREEQGGKAR